MIKMKIDTSGNEMLNKNFVFLLPYVREMRGGGEELYNRQNARYKSLDKTKKRI